MADHHSQLLPPYSDQLLDCHELVAFGLVGWAAWLVLPLSVHLPQLSSSSWWLDQSWRPCWAGCLSLASHPRFQDVSCHSAPELVVGHEELPLAGGWLRDRSCRCASERGLFVAFFSFSFQEARSQHLGRSFGTHPRFRHVFYWRAFHACQGLVMPSSTNSGFLKKFCFSVGKTSLKVSFEFPRMSFWLWRGVEVAAERC